MLRGLNDPYQNNFARSDSAVCVPSNQVSHMRNLVRDTNATSEEHDCTVRVHGMHTTIRTLGKYFGDELAIRARLCLFEKLACKASSFADNEAHGRLLHSQDILSVHCQLFIRQVFSFVRPGYGKRVRGHETDRRHVYVSVLTGLEAPWVRHVDCEADCVAWESFHKRARAEAVAVEDFGQAEKAISAPDGDDAVEKRQLREIGELKVVPHTDDDEDGEGYVEVFESFVEGVTDH